MEEKESAAPATTYTSIYTHLTTTNHPTVYHPPPLTTAPVNQQTTTDFNQVNYPPLPVTLLVRDGECEIPQLCVTESV